MWIYNDSCHLKVLKSSRELVSASRIYFGMKFITEVENKKIMKKALGKKSRSAKYMIVINQFFQLYFFSLLPLTVVNCELLIQSRKSRNGEKKWKHTNDSDNIINHILIFIDWMMERMGKEKRNYAIDYVSFYLFLPLFGEEIPWEFYA